MELLYDEIGIKTKVHLLRSALYYVWKILESMFTKEGGGASTVSSLCFYML